MNRRKFFAALAVIIMAITVFSFTTHTQQRALSSSSAQEPGQPQGPDVPDEIAYRHLFRYVAAIKKKAEEAEGEGKDAKAYRTHFKRMANLSDYHAQVLNDVATQYEAEILPVDARARLLIEAYRAQYPNGKVPHGQKPEPPPAELAKLREERDAIVLRYGTREELWQTAVNLTCVRGDRFRSKNDFQSILTLRSLIRRLYTNALRLSGAEIACAVYQDTFSHCDRSSLKHLIPRPS